MPTLTRKNTDSGQFEAPYTGQSRHHARKTSGISGSPATNAVQAFHRNATEGVKSLDRYALPMVTVDVYVWKGDKLVVSRQIERPKALVSGYQGKLALKKDDAKNYELLDQLLDFDVKSPGYQAPTKALIALAEAWMKEYGQKLDGSERLQFSRAITIALAARHGADVTQAGAI